MWWMIMMALTLKIMRRNIILFLLPQKLMIRLEIQNLFSEIIQQEIPLVKKWLIQIIITI